MDTLTAGAASSMPQRPTGGLYDARFEHDACGVGMVADLQGRPSHRIVEQGLTVLERLAHRETIPSRPSRQPLSANHSRIPLFGVHSYRIVSIE